MSTDSRRPSDDVTAKNGTGEAGGGYHTFSADGKEEPMTRERAGDMTMGEEVYSLEEAVEHIGFGKFQIRIALLSGLSLLADGMEIFVLSVLGPVLVCEWMISPWQEASLSTVVFTGFLIGAPLLGVFSDRYGRRTSLMFSSLWGLFYGLLSACAPTYLWLLGLRMLVGVGVAGQPQVINYFTEFLPIRIRGRLIMLMYVSLTIGAMLEVVLAILVLQPFGWRWWLFASASPLFIFFCFAWLTMPESPRYLLASGQKAAAMNTLRSVARENKVTLPDGTLGDVQHVPRGRILDLFTPTLRATTLLLSCVWFSTVFCYYGVVLLGTELIAADSNCHQGVDVHGECEGVCKPLDTHDYLTLLLTTSSELPTLLVIAVLSDYIGRINTMLSNFAVMVVCAGCLCFCLPYVVMVLLLYVSRGVMAAQLQLCYLYTSEVYPTPIRGLGLGYGSSIARIGALTTPIVAQVLASRNLLGSLTVYIAVAGAACVCVYFLPIETKGRPLKNNE